MDDNGQNGQSGQTVSDLLFAEMTSLNEDYEQLLYLAYKARQIITNTILVQAAKELATHVDIEPQDEFKNYPDGFMEFFMVMALAHPVLRLCVQTCQAISACLDDRIEEFNKRFMEECGQE